MTKYFNINIFFPTVFTLRTIIIIFILSEFAQKKRSTAPHDKLKNKAKQKKNC
jgi:hypothetical protein